jgi:putative flippase GtrA
LLPDVRDDGWFFDTELLMLAQRRRMRIHEVPVDWVEDPDSRVDIVSTALEDLRGVARLAAASPVIRFMAVGVVSTLAYGLLFLLLSGAMTGQLANAIGLAVTAIANTAANRRLTFGVRGSDQLLRQHAAALHVFVLSVALTGGSLAVLKDISPSSPRWLQTGVLVLASLGATVARYVALRTFVFARAEGDSQPALRFLPASPPE